MTKNEERIYLRSLRVRSGLEQQDVANLLGYKHAASVCKIEDHSRDLPLNIVLGYSIIFKVPINRIVFKHINQQRKSIHKRAGQLLEQIKGRDRPEDSQRIACLETLINQFKPNKKNV